MVVGDEGCFDVEVFGVFKLIVEWFKGRKKIEEEGKFMLVYDEDFYFLVID